MTEQLTCEHCGTTFARPSRFGPCPRWCSRNCAEAFKYALNAEERRARSRARYRDEPDFRRRHREVVARAHRKRRARLNEIKRAAGCIDCGTREGRLDFDHRPGEEKLFNVSRFLGAWEKVEAEIAKCDVRCVSCHARRHALAAGGVGR
jgi:hypothetical protein